MLGQSDIATDERRQVKSRDHQPLQLVPPLTSAINVLIDRVQQGARPMVEDTGHVAL